MKKILLGALGVILIAVAGILVAAALQPSTYQLERHLDLAATPEEITPFLTDLRKWSLWNPWDRIDPNLQLTYSEPSSGVGAHYEWVGNDDVGSGRMDIRSIEPMAVGYDLHFITPFDSRGRVTFSMTVQNPTTTRVTWAMTGNVSFMEKIFFLFSSMDAMLGPDFERGLHNLGERVAAARVEAQRQAALELARMVTALINMPGSTQNGRATGAEAGRSSTTPGHGSPRAGQAE